MCKLILLIGSVGVFNPPTRYSTHTPVQRLMRVSNLVCVTLILLLKKLYRFSFQFTVRNKNLMRQTSTFFCGCGNNEVVTNLKLLHVLNSPLRIFRYYVILVPFMTMLVILSSYKLLQRCRLH